MSAVLLVLNILLGIIALICWFLHSKFRYWKHRNLPYIEPEFFYGNARGIGKDFHPGEFFKRMYLQMKSQGRICGAYILFQTVAIATDLDLIRNIFVKDFDVFPNRGVYFNEADDPLSATISAIEDEAWRSMRLKLTKTFTSGKLKKMFSSVVEITERLVTIVEAESKLEAKEVLSRFTTDVIGSIAFGIDCNSLQDKSAKFYEMGLKSFTKVNFVKRFLQANFRDLARKLHMTLTAKEVEAFYLDVVSRTIAYREANPHIQRNDYMEMLIKLKNSNELTLNQVTANALVFFLGGFETASTCLTFTFYELSINEDVQAKARESVREALEKHSNELTYECVADMQYLEQCVYEALRKYPPAAAVQRVAKKDYHVANTKFTLRKGEFVFIPIYGIHWDPEIYPEPEKFDPDRFSREETAKRHAFSFIPFGEGMRACMGLRFAIVELKIALAKILLNFKFSLDRSRTSVPISFSPNSILLKPGEGVFIDFVKI